MGMTTAQAVHEEAPAEVCQFECLEKPLFRGQLSKYLDILPMIGAVFGIGGHGTVIYIEPGAISTRRRVGGMALILSGIPVGADCIVPPAGCQS
jgi:hypothetical protein